ncbi:hypothetical protein EDB85DRAFT_2156319 [Lactarius pseudohatsudake]|nr:hypothetical protein EDB85DRAFT_2156319 [Lactarius pseudohatsudake]
MERQLWRLQDLRDSGGFGFSIELSSLTFKDIASDWRQHKGSIGTQRVILNLVCDIAIPFRGIFSNRQYPKYITDELLVLLQHMVEEQVGSHLNDAMSDLERSDERNSFADEAKKVISRSHAFIVSRNEHQALVPSLSQHASALLVEVGLVLLVSDQNRLAPAGRPALRRRRRPPRHIGSSVGDAMRDPEPRRRHVFKQG